MWDFRSTSGVVLPELWIHHRTLGGPRRDRQGVVRNAVLVPHGTAGNGANFLRAEFAGELFGKGQPLDAPLHHPPPRHRSRLIEQAQRRPPRGSPATATRT